MFKRIGRTIELTRGDSAWVGVASVNPDGSEYALTSADELVMTVKESTRKEEYAFQVKGVAGEGGYIFYISPEQTKQLRYKDYVYDVQLSINNGEFVNTIVPPSVFRITEEVTF